MPAIAEKYENCFHHHSCKTAYQKHPEQLVKIKAVGKMPGHPFLRNFL